MLPNRLLLVVDDIEMGEDGGEDGVGEDGGVDGGEDGVGEDSVREHEIGEDEIREDCFSPFLGQKEFYLNPTS